MSIKPGYRKPTRLLTKYERNRRIDRRIKIATWIGIMLVSFFMWRNALTIVECIMKDYVR